jgi:hypothetical protein
MNLLWMKADISRHCFGIVGAAPCQVVQGRDAGALTRKSQLANEESRESLQYLTRILCIYNSFTLFHTCMCLYMCIQCIYASMHATTSIDIIYIYITIHTYKHKCIQRCACTFEVLTYSMPAQIITLHIS